MEYSLNPPHLQEVTKYVNFFEQRRKESLKEIQTSILQFQEKKIKDDILSRAEVETLLLELREEVKATMDSELQTIVYMSGVYIKILMSQAETHNLVLQGDVSFIENEKAIEEMRSLGNFERDLMKKTQGARLPTLSNSDPGLASKNRELNEENSALKRKVSDQQTRITEILEELSKFRSGNEFNETEVKEVSQALEETKVIGK